MKMKRYVAPSIRQALAQVREEQGPDAVILSNRQVADGIEVVAAMDYDEALLQASIAETTAKTTQIPVLSEPSPAEPTAESTAALISAQRIPEPSGESPAIGDLRNELQSMRSLMQEQLARLSWDDLSRRHPGRAALVRNLTALGLDSELTERLAAQTADSQDEASAWREAVSGFAHRIPLSTDDICAQGGVFALVGPTGVGKTTTIAKLAARHALQYGAEQVGLITCDRFRIGAQDHLSRYGAILGIPVQVAGSAAELRQTLDQLTMKKLVLIDTSGFSPRDEQLQARLGELVDPAGRVRLLLTLAANAQSQSQSEVISSFSRLGLHGAVVTKLDESTSLGGLLSALIRAELPICYATNGQRVPEDLRSAINYRAALVRQAIDLAQRYDAFPADLSERGFAACQ